MKKLILVSVAIVAIVGIILPSAIFAHSGRTDSSGGHNCNVGSCAGTYHYHNGGTPPPPPPPPLPPRCAPNSTYSSTTDNCNCNSGYAPSPNLTSCIKIPAHAHAVNNRTDAWQCDSSYKEVGNSCILDTCGKNSSGIPPNCTCNEGYAPSSDKKTCIKLPENSHYVGTKASLWLCNDGYEEIDGGCKLKKVEIQINEDLISSKVKSVNNLNSKKNQDSMIEKQNPQSESKSFFEKIFGWLFE